ncbi:cilia- and flagella-associated protein 74 isoform X2, partial [Silurus asotus]
MACELEAAFRPLMVVDSSLIDFGTHVVGETISRVITLTNRGALGTRYSLAPLPTNCLQLQNLLHHSSSSKQCYYQEPGDSKGVKGAAQEEEIYPEGENTKCGVPTEQKTGSFLISSDTSVGVEASGADGLEESEVTEVEQGWDSEITEFSIGE